MTTITDTHTATPEAFYVMQDLVRLHARYEQTGGGFFVMEVEVAPGGGPPPLHTHPAHEFFWTLSGRLTYFRDDGPNGLTEISGGPGTSASIPGGVAHTYRNFSDEPASYLGVLSPPQDMQDFLVEAGIAPGEEFRSPGPWAPSLHDVLVHALRERGIEARFEDSEQLSTTVGKVAAGEGITLSAPAWLDGVPGIVWRPLTDVEIEIRTAAAWRASNRSPLLRALVDLLPPASLTFVGRAEVRAQSDL